MKGKEYKENVRKRIKNESFWVHDFFAAIFKQNIYPSLKEKIETVPGKMDPFKNTGICRYASNIC